MSVQATFAATLVDEWARLGVTDAVVCPGSRSTPLALALHERLRVHVRLDERSAGFYALGLAMATGRPSVVCVTSGTAAAELHPSVVEAHYGRIPLIVCTADRPPELHDTGAPQTIDQDGLFTTATRWASKPGVPTQGQESSWRPLGVRAFAESRHSPKGPGPVHLNLAFREPLGGAARPLPPTLGSDAIVAGAASPRDLGEPLGGRGILIVGGLSPYPPDPRKVLALAEKLRWPVLADPGSRSRVTGTIAAADAIVRTAPALPDAVLLLGAPWLSKALASYISEAGRAGARMVVLDPWGQWPDPTRTATEFHQCDPDQWLAGALEHAASCDGDWLESWAEKEEKAQAAIAETLGTELSEPQVARAVHAHAADTAATVVVSASMPMRDLEWFSPALPAPPRVLANRGANGIDGVVSTALGVAASEPHHRTIALLGDLAFLHDVSGLVNLPKVPCTFVVVDNGGGGIFSFLPQSQELERDTFEELFGTPPTSDLGAVARGFGLPVDDVTNLSELDAALSAPSKGPVLVRVKVPGRAQNAALHQAVNDAVRRALT
ncbi:MAG TPA: 2-succinyl-5-enolpyruvyl-6-hydroxy-3-cyclohexene-1-carboxylic-acid synthase [Acidimicrobiales bacterium]|nr:2-succinyl-5-enolpyruvyl-6-hydroxy-3-cyclohexene-1-carboxylic-acid synthase [Acidimicrobiales bacterium]